MLFTSHSNRERKQVLKEIHNEVNNLNTKCYKGSGSLGSTNHIWWVDEGAGMCRGGLGKVVCCNQLYCLCNLSLHFQEFCLLIDYHLNNLESSRVGVYIPHKLTNFATYVSLHPELFVKHLPAPHWKPGWGCCLLDEPGMRKGRFSRWRT